MIQIKSENTFEKYMKRFFLWTYHLFTHFFYQRFIGNILFIYSWPQNSLNRMLLQIRKIFLKIRKMLQIRKMLKRNIKSFKFVKSVLLMLWVVIVFTVLTVGLVIIWSQISKELTHKRNESMPEEKHFMSILSFIINSYFFKILFLN